MLRTAKIIAFAATTDSTRARAFYQGVLGLDVVSEDEFALVLDAGGTELRIQKVPTLAPQPHTQLGWSVISVTSVIRALHERGIAPELFPSLAQDADGVWTAPSAARIAWLKDPDGNRLSLTEPPRS
jgi:catechol 2,3-dioxygenase-like lactoylglutathione lyase family enzyme